MSWGMVAMAGATLVGGYMSKQSQTKAGNAAARAQENAAQGGIAEQQREFDKLQELLSPYVQAGSGALGQQQNLLGLNGNDQQAAAIQNLQQQPYFQSQMKLGENAILQNAAATGGMRGGNTQGALAYFRPSLLAQTIQQQLGNLGGLVNLGQNSAAGTGSAAMAMGNNITNLLGQQGAAQAGAALNAGAANQAFINSGMQAIGTMFGRPGGNNSGFQGLSLPKF